MHGLLHLAVAGVIGLFVFLVCFIALLVYFLPSFVAHFRKAKSRWWITVLNLLFGWSFIGWVIVFVWAWKDGTNRKD